MQHLERLFLRLQDIRQLDVTRLVQSQVTREYRRQLDLQHFESRIDLARHDGAALAELDFGGEGRLRSVPQRCQHRSGLTVVVVDGLLAEDYGKGLLTLNQRRNTWATSSGSSARVAADQQRAVGAHRERGAQLLLRVRRSDTGNDHLLGRTALLDAQRLLERDLVEGVDAHLYPIERNAAAVRLDANPRARIDHALDADQDAFHPSILRISAAYSATHGRMNVPVAGPWDEFRQTNYDQRALPAQ